MKLANHLNPMMQEADSRRNDPHGKILTEVAASDIRAFQKLRPTRLASWQTICTLMLMVSDVFALAMAWNVAHFFNQFYSPIPEKLIWWTWLGVPSPFWLFTGCTLILFTHFGLYSASPRARDYVKAGQLISYVYLLSLVIVYFYDPKLDPPRSLFFTAWGSSLCFVIGARLVTNFGLQQINLRQKPVSVFLIASAGRLRSLSQTIERRSHYRIVGAAIASTANSQAVFKTILRLQPDEVLADDVPNVELASGLYWRLRSVGIALRLLPSSREMLYRRGMPEIFAGLPTLRIETSPFQTLDYRLKRWLDFMSAGVALIVLMPVLVGIAIAIKLTSPGPALFKQERVGLHGKVFQVWKFRTMFVNAAQLQHQLEAHNTNADGILFKMHADPRITRIGHFLRRTSLDELPQLINVVFGQMSIVGPRPLPLRDVARFDAWHHIRHQVLPGITGLWQISGRSDLDGFDDAARLDLHYIDNWSLNLDLEILVATIKTVCSGKGAY